MWKKLVTFAIVGLGLISGSIAQNKINLPVVCPPAQKITEVLLSYKEDLSFIGIDTIHKVEKLSAILYLNKNTKTYTIFLVAPNQNMTCVISSGEMGELLVKD